MSGLAQGYEFSSDKARLDVDRVAGWLGDSYWAGCRPRSVIDASIAGSFCLGVYCGSGQVAFARVVSDHATFAWVCDVWVDEGHRGKGIGKAMVAELMATPGIGDLRMVVLATRDAHGLYRQFGFGPVPEDRFLYVRKEG